MKILRIKLDKNLNDLANYGFKKSLSNERWYKEETLIQGTNQIVLTIAINPLIKCSKNQIFYIVEDDFNFQPSDSISEFFNASALFELAIDGYIEEVEI